MADDFKEKLRALLAEDEKPAADDNSFEVHVERGGKTVIVRGAEARALIEREKLLDGDTDTDDPEDGGNSGKRRSKAKADDTADDDDEDEDADDVPQRRGRRIFSGYGDE